MSTYIQKSTRSERGSWHRTLPIAAVAATWLISASSAGAVDIQSINLGSLNNGTSSNTNGVQYQGQSQSITSFKDTNNTTWVLTGGATPTLILRRSTAASSDTFGVVNNRQVVWARQQESPGTTPSANVVLPPAPTNTQTVLGQNNIFSGTDNLFTNAGQGVGNQSDVERADFIFNNSGTGVTAAANRAITVFERGATNSHDGFKIAAITALENPTTPSAYGSLLNFDSGTWGQTSLTGDHNYTILNNTDPNNTSATGPFRITDNVIQDIGGVVIPLTQLVAQDTPIYGYSLFAGDVPTNANLVNWNSFPASTEQSTGGGIDLVAANVGLAQAAPVPFNFSPSLGLLLLGATWGAESLWRRNRIKLVKHPKGDFGKL